MGTVNYDLATYQNGDVLAPARMNDVNMEKIDAAMHGIRVDVDNLSGTGKVASVSYVGKLTAGETSAEVTTPLADQNSRINVHSESPVLATSAVFADGKVTVSFPAQESDLWFTIEVTNNIPEEG